MALGVAAALGLLELSGRFLARRWASPEAFSARVENWHRNGVDGSCFRPSAELGFEPIPGTCGYNAYGVVDRGYPLAKPPGTTRLLVLGDSVARRQVFLDVLEEGLTRAHPEHRYEIWNAAVEGYNAVQYSRWFERRGYAYDEDA